MKRKIATLLTVSVLLMVTLFYSVPSLGADAVTSASSTEQKAPAAPAAPAPAPAPATAPAPAAPAKAAPAAPAAVASVAGQLYEVASGDMMWTIAKKFSISLDELISLNPQVKNPNLIFPGQKLVVKAAIAAAAPAAPAASAAPGSMKVYQGFGETVAFRNGPGKDDTGAPVYSFSVAMASATFDADGKILSVYIDGLEVATPNYDGASMPHFSGWPGKEGYNVTDHDTAKVTGVSVNTLESATAEVNAWKTKRERGDSYHMNPANEWYKQMNFYQKFFVGKTVAELEAWFAKNTTAAGRPIKANTTNQADLDKLAKLTDAEKAQLADVVSGATMSVRDAHGDFLGAIAKAYESRVEVTLPVK